MKKDKHPLITPKSIDQFEFHIHPISLITFKPTSLSFFIYVEKGAQVIGKIQEPVHPSNKPFLFDSSHIKRFRVANTKNLIYHWSLYQLTSIDQEEYLESVPFSIKDQFEHYTKNLENVQNDLYRIYHEKDKKVDIEQIWKDLRHDLKSQLEVITTFPKIGIKLTFKIKILCEYDFMYQKWVQIKEKRKNDKKSSVMRMTSTQSKNGMLRTPSENSLSERQKNSDNGRGKSTKENSSEMIEKVIEGKKNDEKDDREKQNQRDLNRKQEIIEQVMESQIRITSPEGVDLTTSQIPQKFLNHRKAGQDQFYYRKKTSMLSDIIEESYEGSSNANLIKSNQGERLKSVDIIQEQEQLLYSPMIKTQTFQSYKHEAYFNDIKRTATLANKHSQEYELEESPTKMLSKKGSVGSGYGKGEDIQESISKSRQQRMSSMKIKSKGSMEIQEQEKQVEVIYGEARNVVIKNSIKVFIIIVLLVLTINLVAGSDRDNTQAKVYKNHRDYHNNRKQEYATKKQEYVSKKQDLANKKQEKPPSKSKPLKNKH